MDEPNDLQEVSNDSDAGLEIRAEYTSIWSAPLPRPEVLGQYEEILPGAADRILTMAEEQSRHRQAMERAVVASDVYSEKAGLWLGFVLAVLVILCGAGLIYLGRTDWGAGLVTLPLISLVGIFVYGKREQRRSLTESKPQQSPQRDLPFPSQK